MVHHKLFVLGAFILEPGGCFLVSEQAHGTVGFDDSLMRYHGSSVGKPQRPEWHPASEFLTWHGRDESENGLAGNHPSASEKRVWFWKSKVPRLRESIADAQLHHACQHIKMECECNRDPLIA